jgi:hypothetical protein
MAGDKRTGPEIATQARINVKATGTALDASTVQRPRCLWLLAAARTGNQAVVATVIRLHPWWRCPARRERAA